MALDMNSIDQVVYGTSNDDLIAVGNGDNTIYTAEGNNIVKSGRGNDLVYGGSGDDRIYTDDGNDTIYAAEGNNIVESGQGDDLVYLGSGEDRVILTAGAGSVTVYGFNATFDQLAWDQSLSGQTIQLASKGGDTLVKAGDDLLATLKWNKLKGSLTTPNSSPPSYQATELGALSPDANNVRGAAINDRGQISGRSETGEQQVIGDRTFILNQGFIWEDGELKALPSDGLKVGGETDGQVITLPGAGGFVQAMNNRGVTVGAADEILGKPTDLGTYWQQNESGAYDLTIYDFGGIESYFFDINSQAQIAGRHIYGPGSAAETPNRSKPIYWEDGLKLDLPSLGGDTGTARGINDQGQIVGQIDSDGLNDKTVDTAALWEKNEDGTYSLTNLGTFGADQSIARDINESGQIIGWATTGTGEAARDSLFLLDHGVNTNLGSLGGKRGQTADINEFGQVVGYSQTVEDKDRAFLWNDGKMYDLNDLVGGKLTWESYEVTLTRATGINNLGDIVSYGTYTYTDAAGKEQTGTRTFLLSAVTETLPIG